MTTYQKKIKHLRATMIHWGEENKIRIPKRHFFAKGRDNKYKLPKRWTKDFRWATKLDYRLSSGTRKVAGNSHQRRKSKRKVQYQRLTQNEMKMCNELYKFYSKTTISSLSGYNTKM